MESQDPIKMLMALVIQGALPTEIRSAAWRSKRDLTDANFALYRNILLIDQIVANYAVEAVDPTWVWGWANEPQQPTAPVQSSNAGVSDRVSRVLRIAHDLINQGEKVVMSKEVARRLKLEGDDSSEKDLATGAGNILARAEGWRKIRPGMYAPVAVQKEMASA